MGQDSSLRELNDEMINAITSSRKALSSLQEWQRTRAKEVR
jgi:hypothetical protein